MISSLLEAAMILCFGLSWPISIRKSWIARTAKGKSVYFTYAIILGYICGIMSKVTSYKFSYVLYLYIVNLLIVFIDLALYYKNRKLDRQNDRDGKK